MTTVENTEDPQNQKVVDPTTQEQQEQKESVTSSAEEDKEKGTSSQEDPGTAAISPTEAEIKEEVAVIQVEETQEHTNLD